VLDFLASEWGMLDPNAENTPFVVLISVGLVYGFIHILNVSNKFIYILCKC
jgi:hypothetical protein